MNLAIIGNSPGAEYWLVSFLVLGVEIAGEGGGEGSGLREEEGMLCGLFQCSK